MTWHSQAAQDEWVHGIIGDAGFFVDVGAHDGVVHSNTYALEQLGWGGICIEPQEAAFRQLAANRPRTMRTRQAVLNHAGVALLRGDTVVSSGSYVNGGDASSIMPCNTLPNILLAFEDVPEVIDYLSIDTEGCEIPILEAMDFDRWTVHLITVEHNLYRDGPEDKEAIFDLLSSKGFERVVEDVIAPGYGPYEDWYQHV